MARPQGESIFPVSLLFAVALVTALVLLTLAAAPVVEAQTLTVIHGFHGSPDGSAPWAGLVRDGAGNVYGTTTMGGESGYGMVFKLSKMGSGWTLDPLYSFPQPDQGQDGAEPNAPVVIGPDGSLYGTTTMGGGNRGIVFKLTPPPTVCRTTICPWNETVLYRFTGGEDGGNPYSPVILDAAGNIYGTTQSGGTANLGVVFKLTPTGSGWTESVLYSFTGMPDGSQPESGLVLDAAGNLYGTTADGGAGGSGMVFQLVPSGSGWTENVLYSFGPMDGYAPFGSLIFDRSGNLFGTTAYSYSGDGTVFELSPAGGGQWNFTNIQFLTSGAPGVPGAVGTLLMDNSGNLFGTTFEGGLPGCGLGFGCGTIFELSPGAGGWTYNLLYQYTGESDGGFPVDGLTRDSRGNIYGAGWGGNSGNGVVFELIP